MAEERGACEDCGVETSGGGGMVVADVARWKTVEGEAFSTMGYCGLRVYCLLRVSGLVIVWSLAVYMKKSLEFEGKFCAVDE